MNIPKYRAWHKQEQRMYTVTNMEWCNTSPLPICRLTLLSTDGLNTIRNVYGEACNNYKLMECIGHRDLNGKEIYEDDIVLSSYAGNAKQMPVKRDYVSNDYGIRAYGLVLHDDPSEVEVIGNIFQHPELIKQEPAQ